MASLRPDEEEFILLNKKNLGVLLVVATLLLVLFAAKKPFGGIFQTVLNSAIPTSPEWKRSSLDFRLENTVCWFKLVVALILLVVAEVLLHGKIMAKPISS
jgi:hypothetical protein